MNKLVTTEEYEFFFYKFMFAFLKFYLIPAKLKKNYFPTLQRKDEIGQDRASKYIFEMVTKM